MLIKYRCRGNSLHTLALGVGEDFRELVFGLCREGWYSHNGFSLRYWLDQKSTWWQKKRPSPF